MTLYRCLLQIHSPCTPYGFSFCLLPHFWAVSKSSWMPLQKPTASCGKLSFPKAADGCSSEACYMSLENRSEICQKLIWLTPETPSQNFIVGALGKEETRCSYSRKDIAGTLGNSLRLPWKNGAGCQVGHWVLKKACRLSKMACGLHQRACRSPESRRSTKWLRLRPFPIWFHYGTPQVSLLMPLWKLDMGTPRNYVVGISWKPFGATPENPRFILMD